MSAFGHFACARMSACVGSHLDSCSFGGGPPWEQDSKSVRTPTVVGSHGRALAIAAVVTTVTVVVVVGVVVVIVGEFLVVVFVVVIVGVLVGTKFHVSGIP